MKTLARQLSSFSGIILLAAVMVFSFASCQNEPDPGNDPQIPAALQNTEWQNQGGDTVSFTKDSVTITPASGQAQPFKLKDTSSTPQNGIEQTILFFKDKQSIDNTITYHNGSITMVNFNIIDALNRANGWSKSNNNNNGTSVFGDFKYSYTASSVTITGYTGNGGDITIPETINGKSVTEIKESSFANKNLTKVTIPGSVVSIGEYAFADNHLTSITIPNSVTSIGDNAFNRNFLTRIIIPNSVTSIKNYAFANNQLTSVIIPSNVTSIGEWAFSYNQLTSVSIPDSVTSIGLWAFQSNQLTSVIIPDSVTSLGGAAFADNQLTSVSIPNSVTAIGNNAFYKNPLISVTIPNNVYYDSNFIPGKFYDTYNNKYNKAAGTYTRPDTDSETWTKIN
jgi:hypothetical protein